MSVDGEEGIQVEDTRLKVEGIFNRKSIACAIERVQGIIGLKLQIGRAHV